MTIVDTLGIVFGTLGIAISIWIAVSQHKQLMQLARIGTDTRDTAQKLKSDTYTRQAVDKFFGVGDQQMALYKCVFPVYFDQRPLPLIVSGDYHALHVLQNLLGTDRIELMPVARPDGGGEELPPSYLQGNVIFLCTPQANPALERLAPPVSVSNRQALTTPKLCDIDLPCWFANEHGYGDAPGVETKTIWIQETRRTLQSPSEADYRHAALLERGCVYKPPTDIQVDYAILLRFTHENRKIVVIAGIHQYGTWIGGDFFQKLVIGEQPIHEDRLLSERDFVAVVWGEFNCITFKVTRCDVLEEYLWLRTDDGWERVLHDPGVRTGQP